MSEVIDNKLELKPKQTSKIIDDLRQDVQNVQSNDELNKVFQKENFKNKPSPALAEITDIIDGVNKHNLLSQWPETFSYIMTLSQKLSSEVFRQTFSTQNKPQPDPLGIRNSFLEIYSSFFKKPETLLQYNLSVWQDYLSLCSNTFRKINGETVEPLIQTPKGDKRFKSDAWQDSIFDFIKQSYLMVSNNLMTAIEKACLDLDKKEKDKTLFFAKQFIDAMAPTNFLMTNPEALNETFKTGGKNLIKGLENLVRDFERGQGRLLISQTDVSAFKVGKNLATTPGKVVYKNELLELIHYTPTTEKTYEIPLLILPPFINKFYILDMSPENSMIKWLVDKGFSVFVVSWKNPTKEYASFGFDDYIEKGLTKAVQAILGMTGQKQVSAVGYCIAGTMLSMALAKMKKKGIDWIKNATYFASQSDFSDAGELSLFVDEERIKNYADIMKAAGGVLQGIQMADTFNMLRANDLVWSFVVNNYLLGKDPFPFDLLFWNSDTTRIPMKLQLDYLKHCYLYNDVAQGKFKLGNFTINLKDITIPMYIQSSKEDHIAPAASVYRGAKLYSGLIRFITAGSGHIAGVINHPSKNKYQYWTNDRLPSNFDEWFEGATEHAGSWWNDWNNWLSKQSGKQIKAFVPAMHYILDNAPGKYVRE